MAKRKAPKEITIGVDSVAQEVYAGMEELKDELQSWYDNLPENFQNGDKGSQLQEAISAIDYVSEIDTPDAVNDLVATYVEAKGQSRAARRDNYTAMLNAAADAARTRAAELGDLEFDEDGELVVAEGAERAPGDPGTEEERDSLVSELETFADEAESAASEYESVEFPGMYG